MSLSSDTLRKLASLGLSTEQMAGVLDVLAAVTEDDERRREAQRERTRRFREKHVTKAPVTLQARDGNGYDARAGVTRVEDKTSNSDIEPLETNTHTSKRETDIAAFRRECEEGGLDAERVEALIKHRRAKRGAITGHAAHLFRKAAASCGMTLTEATDTCINRNWVTVDPAYFAGRQPRAGPEPPKAEVPTMAQIFRVAGGKAAENGQERTGGSGFRETVLDLPAVRRAQ